MRGRRITQEENEVVKNFVANSHGVNNLWYHQRVKHLRNDFRKFSNPISDDEVENVSIAFKLILVMVQRLSMISLSLIVKV